MKYRLKENENKLEMKLTMRLRTYSAHAVVMYARGTDYSILEVRFCTSGCGRLQKYEFFSFWLDCSFLKKIKQAK